MVIFLIKKMICFPVYFCFIQSVETGFFPVFFKLNLQITCVGQLLKRKSKGKNQILKLKLQIAHTGNSRQHCHDDNNK